MKVRIDIDCTPVEARTFLGLPDVGPIQQAVMDRLKDATLHNLAAMEPEAMMKLWFPGGLPGWQQFQAEMWKRFAEATRKPGG